MGGTPIANFERSLSLLSLLGSFGSISNNTTLKILGVVLYLFPETSSLLIFKMYVTPYMKVMTKTLLYCCHCKCCIFDIVSYCVPHNDILCICLGHMR